MKKSVDELLLKIKENSISDSEALENLRYLHLAMKESKGNEAEMSELSQPSGQNSLRKTYKYNNPFLRDHLVYNEQSIMGITHASLIINSYFQSHPEASQVRIKRLSFLKLVTLKEEQESVTLEVKTKGKSYPQPVDVVFSFAGQDTTEVTATALIEPVHGASAREVVEFKALLKDKKPIRDLELSGLYSVGVIEMLTSYQTITTLHLGDTETLLEFDLSNIDDLEEFVVHPHVTNVVFLGIIPLMREQKRQEDYLPIGVREIGVRSTEKIRKGKGRVVVRKDTEELLLFDGYIYNEEGALIVEYLGCSLKRLRSETQDSKTTSRGKNSSLAQNSDGESSLEWAIRQYIMEKLSPLLEGAQDAAEEANFMDMGIDSQALTALSDEIQSELKIELYPTLFFEYPNMGELCRFFADEHRESFQRFLPPIETESRDSPPMRQGRVTHGMPREAVKRRSPLPEKGAEREEIAIVGMHGVFAESDSVQEFWKHLENQTNLMRDVPEDHWDWTPWFDPSPGVPGKIYCKSGSFINHVDKFDAEFFKISPREAVWMDPQLRHLLQSVYACSEDAGYPISALRGTPVGVFVGVCFHDYMDKIAEMGLDVDPYIGTGNAQPVISNRVSFLFDFKGPSVTVDTACSSSLYALHQACLAIRNGECDQAFVGGANLLLASWHYRYFCSLGALSTDSGRCHSFDALADGYVPGEAVASILLKPLSQALEDDDHIYGVIKGSAALHGGYTSSLTAPSVEGEMHVIEKAWLDAGIRPEEMGYLEAHGTGTKLGDPIEASALTKLFKKYTDKEQFCVLGSSKAHIGHTEGAAGITGVIKVLLQMQNKKIPRMPQFKQLNPYINLKKSALRINTDVEDWRTPLNQPRYAGISSFGFSGAYAHVVLSDYNEDNSHKGDGPMGTRVLILSARNGERLREYAHNVLNYLVGVKWDPEEENWQLARLIYTYQTGRESMRERLAVLGSSKIELIEGLKSFVSGEEVGQVFYGSSKSPNKTDLNPSSKQKEIIEKPVSGKEVVEMAQLWIQGVPVVWSPFLESRKLKRMAGLPTYPFAKTRYWVSDDLPKFERKHHGKYTKLHALVDKNVSSIHNIGFLTQIDSRRNFLLSWEGKTERLLSNSFFVEMVRACGILAGVPVVFGLRDVCWAQPEWVGGQPLNLVTKLDPQSEGIRFEVSCSSGDTAQKVLCHGWLLTVETSNNQTLQKVERNQNYEIRLDNRGCDALMGPTGRGYSHPFVRVKELRHNSSEVEIHMALIEGEAGEDLSLALSPQVIDVILYCLGISVCKVKHCDDILQFYRAGKIQILNPLTEDIYVQVTVITPGGSSQMWKVDIVILNDKKEVCALLQDLSLKAFGCTESSAQEVNGDKKIELLFQQLKSQESTVDQVLTALGGIHEA